MNWQDTGFLLSKNKYSENNSIAEFYTKNHGKVTGVIYGSTSKKIKNYLFMNGMSKKEVMTIVKNVGLRLQYLNHLIKEIQFEKTSVRIPLYNCRMYSSISTNS